MDRMKRAKTSIGALIFALACVSGAKGADLQAMADAIRYEATLPPNGEVGKPLPLLSHWCTGALDPRWRLVGQIQLMEEGHYILPWVAFPTYDINPEIMANYKSALGAIAELKLPLSFRMNQLESGLYEDAEFRNLNATETPRVVLLDGTMQKLLCPFGPIKHWNDIGRKVIRSSRLNELQAIYPDPPLVIFVSNNEPGLLKKNIELTRRFVDLYGTRNEPDLIRKAVADGYILRYRAYQEAMKVELFQNWAKSSRFIAYKELAPEIGRYSGWAGENPPITGRFLSAPYKWDGASPSYYLHDWMDIWDYREWSPQIETMNYLMMLDEAYAINPDFWFELSVWDGGGKKYAAYEARGQSFTPERYEGFTQYGMWLTRPRVMREFRGSTQLFADFGEYFYALARGVDRVHNNETLKRWWRKGELVVNPVRKHPYQSAIPKVYEGKERWFLLDADLNGILPPGRALEFEIKVFSLAHTMGEAPNREWLIYAHAPQGDESGVNITIPSYKAVKVDVKQAGSFYTVSEANGAVVEVVDQE